MKFEAVEDQLWTRNDGRFGDAAVKADAQAEQAGEGPHLVAESAENKEKENQFGDKIGEEKLVDAEVLGVAELIIALEETQARAEEPEETNDAKNAERQDYRERAVVIIANDFTPFSPAIAAASQGLDHGDVLR